MCWVQLVTRVVGLSIIPVDINTYIVITQYHCQTLVLLTDQIIWGYSGPRFHVAVE